MDNNLISNQKKEVPSGISLNDKDFITSLLSCLKNMEKNYTIALTEASNETLYQKYYDIFLRLAQLQRDVYELMFSLGWYTLEKAPGDKMNQKHQTLDAKYQELQLGKSSF